MNLNTDPQIYGGKEPVAPLEYKKLEIQRLKDIADFKRLENGRRRHWEFFWQGLIAKYPGVAKLPIPKTPNEAFRRYEEVRKKVQTLPPLENRFLDDLRRAEDSREKRESIEKQRLPHIKKLEHHDDDHVADEKEVKYMDHDARYHKLLDANPHVVKLRETRKDLATVPTIVPRNDGSLYLNPELSKHFERAPEEDDFTIEEAVRVEFTKLYKEAAEKYEENEKSRIYADPMDDPALKRVKKKIEKEKATAIAAQQTSVSEPSTLQTQIPPAITEAQLEMSISAKEFHDFAVKYPQKAAAYATYENPDQRILTAWKKVKEEQKQADVNQAYESVLKRNLDSVQSRPTQIVTSSIQEQTTPPDLRAMRRTVLPAYKPISSGSRPHMQPDSQSSVPLRGNNRTPIKGGQPLNNMRGTVSGMIRGAQLVSRVAPLLGWFLTPPGIATMVGVIILFLFLILFTDGGITGKNPDGTYSVRISKVGPSEVPNPEESDITKPDPSDIMYTINVSYAGAADSILVTDPLDDNATFISAGGPGNPQYDAGSHTVTWNITAENADEPSPTQPTTTTTPSPTTLAKRIQQNVLAASIDVNKYTESPYNLLPPNGSSDVDYTSEIMNNLNTLGNAVADVQNYLQSKYDAKYVDPFLSVIWVGAIEGTLGDPYSWNCQDDRSITINDGCPGGYYSGGWQVGYGIQVSQAAAHLAENFDIVYGEGSSGSSNEEKRVGQSVLDNSGSSSKGQITNPSIFPTTTIPDLVSRAGNGDHAAQQAIAILLMDPRLGAPTVSLEVAADIQSRDDWRATMQSWGSSYYGNEMQQTFSNRMAAIAEKYTGKGGNINNGSLGRIAPLTLVVRPKSPDSWVINQARAEVRGARPPQNNNNDNSNNIPSDNAVEFLRAAEDIKTAYDECGEPPGATHVKPGLLECLTKTLSDLGYSEDKVAAFASRQPGSAPGGCTECLGYVGLVAALHTGETDATKTLAGPGMNAASDLNVAPYGPDGFDIGEDHYMPIGSGITANIEPGDIAIAGTPDTGFGHIGIVRQIIEGSDTHFRIIESNGDVDCRVDITRNYGSEIAKDIYTFYRKQ